MSRSRLNHFLMSVLAVTIVMVVWNESPSSYCHASPRWEHNFFLNCPHFWKYFPVWALLSNNTFLSCKISSLLLFLVFASLLCVWERALSLFSRPPTRHWSPPTHTHTAGRTGPSSSFRLFFFGINLAERLFQKDLNHFFLLSDFRFPQMPLSPEQYCCVAILFLFLKDHNNNKSRTLLAWAEEKGLFRLVWHRMCADFFFFLADGGTCLTSAAGGCASVEMI